MRVVGDFFGENIDISGKNITIEFNAMLHSRVMARFEGKEIRLAELGEGDFFGEMALFEKDVRSATVRPRCSS